MGDLAFLGNPEFGVEFTPIDFIKFAEACGAKGYTIKEPSKVKSVMRRAMSEKNPTVIEAYVDPFEPPLCHQKLILICSKYGEFIWKGTALRQKDWINIVQKPGA